MLKLKILTNLKLPCLIRNHLEHLLKTKFIFAFKNQTESIKITLPINLLSKLKKIPIRKISFPSPINSLKDLKITNLLISN